MSQPQIMVEHLTKVYRVPQRGEGLAEIGRASCRERV